LKILDALKTAALFLIAAGLFSMSYVIYNVMEKHSRYVPVSFEDDQIVVMDTHTGHVWSANYEVRETTSPKDLNPINSEIQKLLKRASAKLDP
jgi:hypothetical protein